MSIFKHPGSFLLQSLNDEQQALIALILLHGLLDSTSELLMYVPAGTQHLRVA